MGVWPSRIDCQHYGIGRKVTSRLPTRYRQVPAARDGGQGCESARARRHPCIGGKGSRQPKVDLLTRLYSCRSAGRTHWSPPGRIANGSVRTSTWAREPGTQCGVEVGPSARRGRCKETKAINAWHRRRCLLSLTFQSLSVGADVVSLSNGSSFSIAREPARLVEAQPAGSCVSPVKRTVSRRGARALTGCRRRSEPGTRRWVGVPTICAGTGIWGPRGARRTGYVGSTA
jgi:hypothetical protein